MLAIALLAAVLLSSAAEGYQYPAHGSISTLSPTCLTDMDNIFNNLYLLTSTAESQDNRTKPWFVNPQRRLGCRLVILNALESSVSENCPTEEQLVNCFWIGGSDWSKFVHKCELFNSQKPLPACSNAAGEAAEGIPSCDTSNQAVLNSAGPARRLLQNAANDAGIATWSYSNGEAAGLQYDHFAPAGSPYAQPPLGFAGATGVDAVILGAQNEGNEGASVSAGSTVAGGAGCFPGFWTASDFDNYLNGNLTETARPKDIGGVNAVGLVSVFIYTLALCSLGLF